MRYLLGLLTLMLSLCQAVTAAEITPNHVYAEALRVAEEIKVLKHHFNITQEGRGFPINLPLTPRHIWQKTYEVLYKLNIFREKLGMPSLSIPSRQPQLELSPAYAYEQILRILTEIDIIKRHLDISEKTELAPSDIMGKTSTDNFNLLNDISYQIDLLNGTSFTPSSVFSQSIRVIEDVNIIVDALELRDTTIPPARQNNALPQDSFNAAIRLLEEVRRVQLLVGIDTLDVFALKSLFNSKEITPSDVFVITGFLLAELQSLKGYLGLKNMLTPPARHYENMVPENVQQVLGWATRKLQLVKTLNRKSL